jgi:hypothetical protein
LGELERSEVCGGFITSGGIGIKSKGERISIEAVEGHTWRRNWKMNERIACVL